jgi:hypothetical protein
VELGLTVKWKDKEKGEEVLEASAKVDEDRLAIILGFDPPIDEEKENENEEGVDNVTQLMRLLFRNQLHMAEGSLFFSLGARTLMLRGVTTILETTYNVSGNLDLSVKLKDGSTITFEGADLEGSFITRNIVTFRRHEFALLPFFLDGKDIEVTKIVKKDGKEITYKGKGQLEISVEEMGDKE